MTAATMLETIYAHQSDQAATFLSTPNEHTRRLPYVGTAADKVCDSKFASWEIVSGRVNFHGTPVSFIMELREITSDSADGDTCLAEIDGAHARLKVVASQRRTYCFDGEACYQGEVTAVKAQLLAREPSTVVWHDPPHAGGLVKDKMHDEFGYLPVIHETIRQIYSHFSRSPKRWRGLEATASELGVELAQLHYIFEVRMVESETAAFKNFMTDLPAIEAQLLTDIEAAEGTAEAKTVLISKARAWRRQIRQFKFVAVTLVLLDVNETLRKFSKATQADAGLAIDVPGHRASLEATLTARRDGALGPKMTRNARQLCSGKFGSTELIGVPLLATERAERAEEAASALPADLANAPEDELWDVEAIIEHKPIGRGFQYLVWWAGFPRAEATWARRVDLRPVDIDEYWAEVKAAAAAAAAAPGPPSPPPPLSPPPPSLPPGPPSESDDSDPPSLPLSDIDSEDETLGEALAVLRAQLKADLSEHPAYQRILSYQRAICESLLRHMPGYLAIPEVVTHLARITDFRAMPLESTAEAHTALETWGNESILWLVANVLTHLDADVLCAEAMRVRFFVRDHKKEWMLQYNVIGEDGKVMGTERRLTLTGETSIAATLFNEPARVSGGVPHQFLEVMDYMISFRFNQSDTERAGRTMTLTKPALRSSLGNMHFKQAAWVAFNSPGFHEIDIMALVKRWKADGHLSAVMKDASGPRAKEVLERKAREHKVSFLC